MAATIKELAEKAFPTMQENDKEGLESLKYIGIDLGPEDLGMYNTFKESQQAIYTQGANAMLEEIEKIIDREDWTSRGYILSCAIRDRIKELKGKENGKI